MVNINRSGKSGSSDRFYLLGIQRLYTIDYCPVFKSQYVVAKKEIVSLLPYPRTEEAVCSPAENSHTLPLLTPLLLPSQGWRMKADAQRRPWLCFSIWGSEPEQAVFQDPNCTSLHSGKWGSFSQVGWEGTPTGRELFWSSDFSHLTFTSTLRHHSAPATLARWLLHHGKATRSQRQTFKSKRELSF